MSNSGANVLLLFQCPVICHTPSQVDILVSDDFPAFSPTMFICILSRDLSQIRIKNEVGTGFPVFLLLTVPRWYGAAFVDRIF